MFCPNCGKENPQDQMLCVDCGTSLSYSQTQPEPAQGFSAPPPPAYQAPPPAYQAPVYSQPIAPAEQNLYQPMRLKDWLLTMLIMIIPIVNIVMIFVWAFGSDVNPSKKSYFRAMLIWCLIGIALSIILSIVIVSLGLSLGGLNGFLDGYSNFYY